MTSKDFILNTFRAKGKADAKSLQTQASNMSDDELFENKSRIPVWREDRSYNSWPLGAPVIDDTGRIWRLAKNYDGQEHPKSPINLRAYWKICHPKNIAYAQKWVAPYGTNGAYMRDEVYKDSDGIIWKCKEDYCITDQKEHPSAWVKI